MKPVDLPQAAAHPVPCDGFSQLFSHGDAHPIFLQVVGPAIENQIPVCSLIAIAVQAAKNVVELQWL